jgi:ribose transport system substrate-binding protein
MRKISSLVSCFAIGFMLFAAIGMVAAGGQGESEVAPDSDGGIVIGYAPAVYDSTDYFGQFDAGLRDTLTEAGVSFSIRGRAPLQESDLSGHMAIVEDFVTIGVDYIIFGPTDPEAVIPAIEQANAAGIPVIINNHLTPLPEDANVEVLTYAGYSHEDGAVVTANYIVDNLLSAGDEAAILFGQPGAAASAQRGEPAKRILLDAGINIVYEQPADWQRERAYDATERLLAAHPDVKLVYAVNSAMAMGAAEATVAADRRDVHVFGYGSVIAEIDMIWEGLMTGSIFRDAYNSGQQGADAILRHMNGQDVPPQYASTMVMLASREDILSKVPQGQLEQTQNWEEMRAALGN